MADNYVDPCYWVEGYCEGDLPCSTNSCFVRFDTVLSDIARCNAYSSISACNGSNAVMQRQPGKPRTCDL